MQDSVLPQEKNDKCIMGLFGSMDTNGDGVIDMTEFEVSMRKSTVLDLQQIQRLFQTADTDGNGSIDLEEFTAFISADKLLRDDLFFNNQGARRTEKDPTY